MNADLSRVTFDPAHHYRRVPLQQGRVQTDADTNEHQQIVAHRIETEAVDLIGGCGAPVGAAGFGLTVDGDDLMIGKGRFYAGGMLCENEAPLPLQAQSDLPLDPAVLATLNHPHVDVPPDDGLYLVWLDVWERHLTALQAPHIREVALGGPDTATRTRTLWQVRLHPLTDDEVGGADCLTELESWASVVAPSTGQLSASTETATASDDPCIVTPGAGYRRLENQLYRVEVHEGGTRNASTFKWDRDNGSLVTTLEDQDVTLAEWRLARVGRDAVLRITSHDWVELIDDDRELHGVPGTLVQVTSVQGDRVTVDLDSRLPAGASVDMADFRSPRVRRWNGILTGVANQDPRPLEGGVQVALRGGDSAPGLPRTYRTGDHWMIPARTATGEVEWPTADGGWRSAAGIHHHACRLGLVEYAGGWGEPTDCRELFPPVTALTNLLYVGGDAQWGLPDPTAPATLVPLAEPLAVRVVNGSLPVEGAMVRFSVVEGGGVLNGDGTTVRVPTDGEEAASCTWELDATTVHQACTAELLDASGSVVTGQALRFHASLATAARVAYDPAGCDGLAGVVTVQDAIDSLCARESGAGRGCCVVVGPERDFPDVETAIEALLERGETHLCLCLEPGEHVVGGFHLDLAERGARSLVLHGCGARVRLHAQRDVVVVGAERIELRGLDLTMVRGARLQLLRCREVTVEDCRISGQPQGVGLVLVDRVSRVRVDDSTLEALVSPSLDGLLEVIEDLDPLPAAFGDASWQVFRERAPQVAEEVANLSVEERAAIAEELRQRIEDRQGEISLDEANAHLRLAATLEAEAARVELLDQLIGLRRAALDVEAGIVLEIGTILADADGIPTAAGSRDGAVVLEHNDITGSVGLCGAPSAERPLDEEAINGLTGLLRSTTGVDLVGSDVDVTLVGNRLTNLLVGAAMVEAVGAIRDGDPGTRLYGLPASLHATDNRLTGALSGVVARQLALTSNEFSLGAVRSGDSDSRTLVLAAVADSMVVTGNHGQRRGHGVDFHAHLVHATRADAEAANLDLRIGQA